MSVNSPSTVQPKKDNPKLTFYEDLIPGQNEDRSRTRFEGLKRRSSGLKLNWRRFFRHLTAYSIPFIGFGIIILMGYEVISIPVPWADIVHTVSVIFIGGGVFSLAMNAIKIFPYFEEKLTNILYGNDFLEKRKDLSDLWDRVTEILYHQRFPKISNKIHSLLKDNYLNSSNKYYSSYIEMKSVFKRGLEPHYIICTDVIKQKITMSDHSSQKIRMSTSIDFDEDEDNRNSYNRLIKLKVDNSVLYDYISDKDKEHIDVGGASLDLQESISRSVSCKTDNLVYFITLAGKQSYTVTRVTEKKYDLRLNTIKVFTATHIWRRMAVFMNHPDDIILDHSELGTVKPFERLETGELCKLHLEYNHIVLPHQGIVIGISEKN